MLVPESRGRGPAQVLSEQWNNIAGLMGRVHQISDAVRARARRRARALLRRPLNPALLSRVQEARLPKDKKNGTLWETEELALRYAGGARARARSALSDA